MFLSNEWLGNSIYVLVNKGIVVDNSTEFRVTSPTVTRLVQIY